MIATPKLAVMQPKCPLSRADCPLRPVSRERHTEIVEDVIYVEQKIKKFDREGSERIELAKMPEFVEREVEFFRVTYRCDACGHCEPVRENPVANS